MTSQINALLLRLLSIAALSIARANRSVTLSDRGTVRVSTSGRTGFLAIYYVCLYRYTYSHMFGMPYHNQAEISSFGLRIPLQRLGGALAGVHVRRRARRPVPNQQSQKEKAKGFAPPPGPPGVEAQAKIVARWWPQTAGSAPIPIKSNFTAGSTAVVESRLSREPANIRDLARNFSQQFASQAEDLKRSRPNDERGQHDNLLAFFERMADGLAQLAGALDQAVKE